MRTFKLTENWKWICTTIIAISGLGLAIWQGCEDHHYKRLSAKPILSISTYQNGEGVGFLVLSGGLGPAVLKWSEISVDGVPQKNWESIDKLLGLSSIGDKVWTNPKPGAVLQPGSTPKLYWRKPGPNAELLKMDHKRITIRICYCSMYEECWLAIYENGEPSTNDYCGPAPKILFPS